MHGDAARLGVGGHPEPLANYTAFSLGAIYATV
jgi:hypothetical protein